MSDEVDFDGYPTPPDEASYPVSPTTNQVDDLSQGPETASIWWGVVIGLFAIMSVVLLGYQLLLNIGLQEKISSFDASRVSWENSGSDRKLILEKWAQMQTELEERVAEINTRLADNRGQLNAFEAERAQAVEDVSEKQTELQSLLKKSERAKLELTAAKKEKTLSEVLKKKTEEQRDAILDEWRTANSSNKALLTKITNVQSEFSQAEANLAEAEEKLRGKDSEIKRVQSKITALKSELEQQRAEKEQELEQLQSRISDQAGTSAEYKAFEVQQKTTKAAVKQAQQDLESLEERAATVRGELKADREILLQNRERITTDGKLRDALQEEIKRLQEEIKGLQEKASEETDSEAE